MEHKFTHYESDFLEPGYKAVCSCGWESRNMPTMSIASPEWDLHLKQVSAPPAKESDTNG